MMIGKSSALAVIYDAGPYDSSLLFCHGYWSMPCPPNNILQPPWLLNDMYPRDRLARMSILMEFIMFHFAAKKWHYPQWEMEKLKRSLSFRKKKDHVPECSKPHQWQEDERKVREGTCSFQVRVSNQLNHTNLQLS